MMKTVKGIGTTATRDSTIEKLVERGFIEKKKKQIISTTLERALIRITPEDFFLYSDKLTAYSESMLSQVEQGELGYFL
ncbi:DNA topoisomerase [Niallia taxi]|nr:DNA topoisomerase [Niallia taxi]